MSFGPGFRKLLTAALTAAVWTATAAAQFTPEETARRGEWETFLLKAKIVGSEKIGEGVTKPRKLHLRLGELEGHAVWKRPSGIGAGVTDKWECEIAAYRLDKLLALGMVPPTVERSFRLNAGSLQLWADLPMSELKMHREQISVSPEKAEGVFKARALQRAFDSLIANTDRSLQNIRYTPDWRLILIDHSRAFRDTYPHVERLIYGRNGLSMKTEFAPLPRAFVEALGRLTAEAVRGAVGNCLTSSEIKAVLVRRDALLREIADEITRKGEASVLY
ncbi:MAG: hypothetical protein FJY83_02135 [Candidatus Aminicenantes bacterium]|nr:hypothetical protein [Candidatus Aminicenantes bacterium]